MRFGYTVRNSTLNLTTNNRPGEESSPGAALAANIAALATILRWNAARGIMLFRLGERFVPPPAGSGGFVWEPAYAAPLRTAGELAGSLDIRLSLHAPQVLQPGHADAAIARRSIESLRHLARVLAVLHGTDGDPNRRPVLVLHPGGKRGEQEATARRLVERLADETEVLRFLALENDEVAWPPDLVLPPARALRIPLIVDTLHHAVNPGGWSLAAALEAAWPTWPGRPEVHLSSQAPDKQRGAHAAAVRAADVEALHQALPAPAADVMVEAKGKEAAVLPLLAV